jgi:hypothetical protein
MTMNNLFITLLLAITAHPLLSADDLPNGLLSYKEKGYTRIQVRVPDNLPEEGYIICSDEGPSEEEGLRFDLIKNIVHPHDLKPKWINCLEEFNAVKIIDPTERIYTIDEAPAHVFYRKHPFCEICKTYCIDNECGYSLHAVPEDEAYCSVALKFNSYFPPPPLAKSETVTTIAYLAPESPDSTSISPEAKEQVGADLFSRDVKPPKKGPRRKTRKPKKILLFHIG